MDEFEALKEKMYEENLEGELHKLYLRRESDPEFTLEKLKIILDSECRFVDEGARDRGGIQHIDAQARLAAHEIFYHEWKKESAGSC